MPDLSISTACCPYLQAGREECYCVNVTSRKIPKALRYCGTNYLDCPILQKLKERDKAATHATEPDTICRQHV